MRANNKNDIVSSINHKKQCQEKTLKTHCSAAMPEAVQRQRKLFSFHSVNVKVKDVHNALANTAYQFPKSEDGRKNSTRDIYQRMLRNPRQHQTIPPGKEVMY